MMRILATCLILRQLILYTSALCALSGFAPKQAMPSGAETARQTAAFGGIVLDKATQLPVPYAYLTVHDSNVTTQANSQGRFTLALGREYRQQRISVTALGYIPQEFSIADLIKQRTGTTDVKLSLTPKLEALRQVEIKTKASKWKTKKVGYHIDEGSPFHHEFSPSDTLATGAGQEIGNRIYLKKRPAFLQSISFGLAGSGNEKAIVGIRLYSLKDNLPHLNLLPKPVTIAIPAHHTGWIIVNLNKYNITLKDDFAIGIEWLTQTNKLNSNTLMAFATVPKGQTTYYRESDTQPWKIIRSGLLSVHSIGLYATLLYEK